MEDTWHFPRRDVAAGLLKLLGPVNALTIFAPRRTGKTAFVMNDLAATAEDGAYRAAYLDCWVNQANVADALIEGLTVAAERMRVPKGEFRRNLRRPVQSVSAFGASIALGTAPARAEPTAPLSRLAFWLDTLAERAGKDRVLLIIDEAQQLGLDPQGATVAAALRAGLMRHQNQVYPVFLGSSEDVLHEMFSHNQAPLYQFGQQIQLPHLQRDFTDFLADRHAEASGGRQLDRDALWRSFIALGHRPGPLRDMMGGMLRDASTEVVQYLRAQLHEEREQAIELLARRQLRPIDQAVLYRVACAESLFSADALDEYERRAGKRMKPSGVTRILETLERKQLIARGAGRGQYDLEMPCLAEVIRRNVESADQSGADQTQATRRAAKQELATT